MTRQLIALSLVFLISFSLLPEGWAKSVSAEISSCKNTEQCCCVVEEVADSFCDGKNIQKLERPDCACHGKDNVVRSTINRTDFELCFLGVTKLETVDNLFSYLNQFFYLNIFSEIEKPPQEVFPV